MEFIIVTSYCKLLALNMKKFEHLNCIVIGISKEIITDIPIQNQNINFPPERRIQPSVSWHYAMLSESRIFSNNGAS